MWKDLLISIRKSFVNFFLSFIFLLVYNFFMKYDKNGLPIKEYYTEELKTSLLKKMKALEYQKYYTGGSIILMILVLICMYLILN